MWRDILQGKKVLRGLWAKLGGDLMRVDHVAGSRNSDTRNFQLAGKAGAYGLIFNFKLSLEHDIAAPPHCNHCKSTI